MLSLITIVKNEAAGLAEFMAHHQGLCDEIIVVDTGSTDETVAIARKHGAIVSSFAWCDDFAAARNFSLEQAKGDWVLCLDIDEVIDPTDFSLLNRTIAGPPMCYQLPQWNYYNDAQHQEWQPVQGQYPAREAGYLGYFVADQYRLFPTGHGLLWQGRVHEDLSATVRAAGLPSEKLPVPIHHYGYEKSADHNLKRNEMYGRLVRLKIQDDPDCWKANLELAYIMIQEGQAREAMPILAKVSNSGAEGPVLCRVNTMLASLYHADGRLDEAIGILHTTVTDNPNWIFAWADLIKLLVVGEHWEQAESALIVAKETFGEDVLLLKQECQFLINTKQIVAAIPVARRVSELVPSQPEFAALADKCEAVAKRNGLL